MTYTTDDICTILKGIFIQKKPSAPVEYIVFDSRKVYFPSASVFFAIIGERRDGHLYIEDLYQKGVRVFVVSEQPDVDLYTDATFIKVQDTLEALQQIAVFHRGQFSIPVIGVAGSNGKTIVKEWLYQLLHEEYSIVRSPKSYNSQIGVPLSVCQMEPENTLAIFEAGISKPGEMEKLQQMIRPGIGILTNIGDAHNEGFTGKKEKLREKCRLFRESEAVIFCHDLPDQYGLDPALLFNRAHRFTWSFDSPGAAVFIKQVSRNQNDAAIRFVYAGTEHTVEIPFTDEASVENAISCCCCLLYLGIPVNRIEKKMRLLTPVSMRLDFRKGINNCSVINDSYSADINSLHIALNFLKQQGGPVARTVILSDMLQTGLAPAELYRLIADALSDAGVTRVIGVGKEISDHLKLPPAIKSDFFSDTEAFLNRFRFLSFKEEVILLKGARSFHFEEIAQLLEQKTHQTVLEINLSALVHNLKTYQRRLQPSVKTMVMVKAFAYGSGSAEIAGILQYHKVDYLGVAYADEGVELRKAGITLPVMVMNAEESSFESLTAYQLEPVLFSSSMMVSFDAYLKQEGLLHYPVHIEVETGMNRLGFSGKDMDLLLSYLHTAPSFKIQSVFSHLTSGEDPSADDFSKTQLSILLNQADKIRRAAGYDFMKHIANSAAISRLPALQLDMVRLGIGLYGIQPGQEEKLDLQPVATLKSTIAQIRHLQKGDTVSYNRKGIIHQDAVIATVRIGYADGYSRQLGNGKGHMLVNNRVAPTVGTVCMDMVMIDITGIPGVVEGDEVIVFGKKLSIEEMAARAGTIPYEIMTGISQRVKRVYFEE